MGVLLKRLSSALTSRHRTTPTTLTPQVSSTAQSSASTGGNEIPSTESNGRLSDSVPGGNSHGRLSEGSKTPFSGEASFTLDAASTVRPSQRLTTTRHYVNTTTDASGEPVILFQTTPNATGHSRSQSTGGHLDNTVTRPSNIGSNITPFASLTNIPGSASITKITSSLEPEPTQAQSTPFILVVRTLGPSLAKVRRQESQQPLLRLYLGANGLTTDNCRSAATFVFDDRTLIDQKGNSISAANDDTVLDFVTSVHPKSIAKSFLSQGGFLEWTAPSFVGGFALFCRLGNGMIKAIFTGVHPPDCSPIELTLQSRKRIALQ